MSMQVADDAQVVDGLNVASREWAHRKVASRTVEFRSPNDGRMIKLSFNTHDHASYHSPRHRHNFEQIRYVIAGSATYGPLQAEPGDCIYFPEGVYYGPQDT